MLAQRLPHLCAFLLISEVVVQRLADHGSSAFAPVAIEAFKRPREEHIAIWWLLGALPDMTMSVCPTIRQAPTAKPARAAAAFKRGAPLKVEKGLPTVWPWAPEHAEREEIRRDGRGNGIAQRPFWALIRFQL